MKTLKKSSSQKLLILWFSPPQKIPRNRGHPRYRQIMRARGKYNASMLDVILSHALSHHYPEDPCMVYLPTLTIKIN